MTKPNNNYENSDSEHITFLFDINSDIGIQLPYGLFLYEKRGYTRV